MKRVVGLLLLSLSFLNARTFLVNTLSDEITGSNDSGSLRWCIFQANGSPGEDTILINITGTLFLSDTLPQIRDALSIYGNENFLINANNHDVFVTHVDASFKNIRITNAKIALNVLPWLEITVSLSGLDIENSNYGLHATDWGNNLTLKVDSCKFQNIAQIALHTENYNDVVFRIFVESSSFTHNQYAIKIDNRASPFKLKNSYFSKNTYGIYLNNYAGTQIDSILGNVIDSVIEYGLKIERNGSLQALVKNNRFYGRTTGKLGIQSVSAGPDYTLYLFKNRFSGFLNNASGHAIQLTAWNGSQPPHIVIDSCKIASSNYGLTIYTNLLKGVRIENTVVESSYYDGIYISGTDSVMLFQDTVRYNGQSYSWGSGITASSGSQKINIQRTVFYENYGLAIDWPSGVNGGLSYDDGNLPILDSAYILNSGVSRILKIYGHNAPPYSKVEAFSILSSQGESQDPSGFGEANHFISASTANVNGNFEIIASGESLNSGDFVTVTATDTLGNTSEFAGNVSLIVKTMGLNSKDRHFAIYYGWPSYVNGSGGNVNLATQVFRNYRVVVLGAGLENESHPDHENTVAIIQQLQGITEFYGYVSIGVVTNNYPLDTIFHRIDRWKNTGVTGIFIDEAGYDYGVSRTRQNAVVDYAHSKGLKVIVNAWNPEDVFASDSGNPHYKNGDGYCFEEFLVSNFQYVDPLYWYNKANTVKNFTADTIKVYCVAMDSAGTHAHFNSDSSRKRQDYAFWGVLLFGFDYFQYTDQWFSASNSYLYYYPQVEKFIGTFYESEEVVDSGNGVYTRNTDVGYVRLNTGEHTGDFVYTSCPHLCGDLNGDGIVNSEDIEILAQYLYFDGSLDVKVCGDVNNDGVVDSRDIVRLGGYVQRHHGELNCP